MFRHANEQENMTYNEEINQFIKGNGHKFRVRRLKYQNNYDYILYVQKVETCKI